MSRTIALALFLLALAGSASANPPFWSSQWPNTDFSRHSVEFDEIMSGGVRRDGIPPIDDPRFLPVSEITELAGTEPVIGIVVNGDARAYPLRILTWHEIVNDTVGGVPVTVTYCPLCNSGIVFDRRVGDRVLDFGVSGLLRHSDLVMYDRQTESLWQQFMGEAIVGEMTGTLLDMLPSRMESLDRFRERAPEGKVLVPNDDFKRRYGENAYVGYDTRSRPLGFFTGDFPEGIAPMERVVAVEGEAWSLPLLRKKGTITKGDIVLGWEAGQNSALDARRIDESRDVGNVVVRRRVDGRLEDVVHDVTFAFVFHAFHPQGIIHVNE